MSKRKYFLIFIFLIAALLCSVGASAWVITTQTSFAPEAGQIQKITPSVTFPTYKDAYEGDTPLLSTAGSATHNGSAVAGQFTVDAESLIYNVNGTSAATDTVTVTAHFTPSDTATYESVTGNVSITLKAVAYINSTYYGTIEQALVKSVNGNEVFVIPATNPTVRKDCEVKSGVTLTIPYEDQTYANRDGSTTSFADAKPETNLKNNVKLNDSVTLTVNGRLNIGGILGCTGTGLAGMTSGSYTQITMGSASSIVSKGTIDCYGYIKESANNNGSKVYAESGEVYQPFVVYNYKGGTHTAAAYATNSKVSLLTLLGKDPSGNISPFSVFDTPNIQAQLRLDYSASLRGYADLYTGALSVAGITIEAQHNRTTINLIGSSNAVINFAGQQSYALIKYTPPQDFKNVQTTDGTTQIDLYNGASSGDMALVVNVPVKGNMSISTKNVYFPVSWKYNIILHNGSYNLLNKMKFMTGSGLTVESGATLNIGNDTIFYSAFPDNSGINPKYPSKPAAVLSVAGTANIGAPFGGIIQPGSTNAILNITTTTLSLTSSEGDGTRDGMNFIYTEKNSITETARGPMTSGNTENFTNKIYVSENGTQWIEGEGYSIYTIHYDANGGTLTGNEKDTFVIPNKEASTTIYDIPTPDPVRKFYRFVGWYDNGTQQPFTGKTMTNGSALNVYAVWEKITYRVDFFIDYKDCDSMGNMTKPNSLSWCPADNETTDLSGLTASDGNLVFHGWFTSADYNNTVTELTPDLFDSLNTTESTVNIYGFFGPTHTYTVNYQYATPTGYGPFNNSTATVNKFDRPDVNIINNAALTQYDYDIEKQYYFSGWYAQCADGTEKLVTYATLLDDTYLDGNGTITLVAKWAEKQKITITLQDNDSTSFWPTDGIDFNLDFTFTATNSSGATHETTGIETFSTNYWIYSEQIWTIAVKVTGVGSGSETTYNSSTTSYTNFTFAINSSAASRPDITTSHT